MGWEARAKGGAEGGGWGGGVLGWGGGGMWVFCEYVCACVGLCIMCGVHVGCMSFIILHSFR